ncbi:MAG: CapA family protein [Deltaproteobacteria bacterium]|nr:CapA family protein [Deltaproteobacteria bacterium]
MSYEAEKGNVTMAFCGDIMPSRPLAVYREPEFLALRDLLRDSDARFANLESTVVRYNEGFPGIRTGTHMVTEPELLEDLKWFGFNMVSCANSHSLNFGEEGLLLQNRYLDAAGIVHAGTGQNLREASSPAYLETPNGRVALVAVTAHLPASNSRAAHQRVDFRGKPGVNALGFQSTFVVDSEAFAALRRIGASLGLERERQRVVDHGFRAPSELRAVDERTYEFRGDRYELGETFDIRTRCDDRDVEENLRQIREARRQADWVIVSLHNQDMVGRSWLEAKRRVDIEEQPDFVVEFAHGCIEAGADVFACHGPHVPLGVELYRGKPIFYSLGNFIFQNETLRQVPAHHFERFGLDPYGTPSDFFDIRTGNDTKGHPATPESWQSVLVVCKFNNRLLEEIRLYPVDLGFGRPRSQRGRPLLAGAELGAGILGRIERLSAPYGTVVNRLNGIGVIRAVESQA